MRMDMVLQVAAKSMQYAHNAGLQVVFFPEPIRQHFAAYPHQQCVQQFFVVAEQVVELVRDREYNVVVFCVEHGMDYLVCPLVDVQLPALRAEPVLAGMVYYYYFSTFRASIHIGSVFGCPAFQHFKYCCTYPLVKGAFSLRIFLPMRADYIVYQRIFFFRSAQSASFCLCKLT
jgi:hypothetical protein